MGASSRPTTCFQPVPCKPFEVIKKVSQVGKKKAKFSGDSSRSTLTVLFISLLLDLVAFTMILPLLPSILDHYSKNDSSGLYWYLSQRVRGFQEMVGAPQRFNTVLFGGLLGSIFSCLQFMASPIVGNLSDIYGRKPVLMVTMAGVTASYLIWAISSNFALFVLSRVIGGLCKGNISLATAVVADVCSPRNRGRGMAMIGIAFSVGFILGPLIGAGFSHWSRGHSGYWFVTPAIFAFALQAVDLLFVSIFFKETLQKEQRSHSVSSSMVVAKDYINPRSLFAFKAVHNVPKKHVWNMQQLGAIYFLFLLVYSGLEFTLTFLVHLQFGYTSMQQGRMFLIMGLAMILTQGGYTRRVLPGKEKAMAINGLLAILPAFVAIGVASNSWVLYLGLLLFSFASATVVPCLTTMVSTYGAHDQKGTVMGIFRSLGALARALGPVLASFAFWSLGACLTYLMGSIAMLLPAYLLMQHRGDEGMKTKTGKGTKE